MLTTKIKLLENEFTNTERKIANYLMDNLDEIKHSTSREVADHLQIGQSNIVRFSQKLGYKGFRDLQLSIDIPTSSYMDGISVDDNTHVTNQKIAEQYIEIVKFTNSINQASLVNTAIKKIEKANKIIVCGIGNSGLFANYLANHLLKMGLISIYSSNAHIIYTTISNANENDLVIAFSETGETKEILKMAKIAKNKNVPLVSITRMLDNKLSLLSDVSLRTSNDMSNSRLNAMTIRCSQLYIIDIICLNLLKNNYSTLRSITLESEKLLDENYTGTK